MYAWRKFPFTKSYIAHTIFETAYEYFPCQMSIQQSPFSCSTQDKS